jgi:hypothetical protein
LFSIPQQVVVAATLLPRRLARQNHPKNTKIPVLFFSQLQRLIPKLENHISFFKKAKLI